MGHGVVRLPPHHCQYNPIELIWAQVKSMATEFNTTFKMADVKTLVRSTLDSDFFKAGLRDENSEPIIMTINSDENSDSKPVILFFLILL